MYDLGDTVGLAVDVKDSDGVLTNATTAAITITLPDGTTATPSVTNPPASTGQYILDYVPTQAGRHLVRWVFTSPEVAFTDSFDVRPTDPDYIVSLADFKSHLNITGTADDEELRGYLEAATHWVEDKVGPVARRTYEDVVTGGVGSVYMTLHRRVLSVTSVTVIRDGSTPVDPADIDIEGDAGILRIKNGSWFPMEPWRLTYVCGRTIVPANITHATMMLAKFFWETQRGGAGVPLQGGGPGDMLAFGLNVPPRVLALLESSADKSGFA